jgi:nucleotide-binding universal stress UspA family protein
MEVSMIGTVIVPLDGSSLSERALVHGAGMASRTGAELGLIRIARIGADEPELAEIRNYLARVAGTLAERADTIAERGRPAETIIKYALERENPVIVMSTHGRGGIQRWMTGSVADEVVRSAGIPVLLVRGDKELPVGSSFEIPAILVPLDGSEQAECALEHAVGLARAFDSKIHLLRVVDTPSAYAMLSRHMETAVTGDILDQIIDSMRRESSTYLEELAARISSQGVNVSSSILEGYPGEQIVEFERRGFFQLVVMATTGRSGVSRFVFGSVAERVLKLGRSPVMMVPPVN